MRKTAKILCCLLALVMLMPLAIACKKDTPSTSDSSSDSQSQGDTTKPKETDKWGQDVVDNKIPDDLNYNGKTVNILIRSGDQYRYEWNVEKVSSSLDQEIYYRNMEVCEQLGVTFNFIVSDEGSGLKTINEKILNVGRSGLGGIDIVNNYRNGAANTNLIPYYMNLRSEQFTYLNLDQPYWSQNFNEAAEAFGRQYFMVGDINLSLYDRAIVVFFNKTKIESYLNMTADDLYQMVLDKEWTYEVFYNLIKDIWEDGGTTGGVADSKKSYDDFVGVSSIKVSEASDGFFYSWNIPLTKTNEDGTHAVITDSARVKMSDAFTKLTDFWYSKGAYLNTTNSLDNIKHFTTGHCLFNVDTLYHFPQHMTELESMTDGYGVVPTPMYDENQKDVGYLTGVQDAHNAMSVMYYGMGDYTMISAVLELLCSKSYEQVRPYYIETIVKGQRLDAKSGQCFELIMDGVTLDFSDIYAPSIGDVRGTLWREPFKNFETGGSFTTAINSNESALNEKITTIDQWLVTHY